jgi:hypothetical protein
MKKKPKKRIALPRRQWQINRVTRMNASAEECLRPRARQEWQQSDED